MRYRLPAATRCTIALAPVGELGEWAHHLARADREGIRLLSSGVTLVARDGLECHTFAVAGSRGARYLAQVIADASGVYTTCECLAGLNGGRCKHAALVLRAMGMLAGDGVAAAVA